ncbi:hypothetical protein Tco_0733382 [Tanacetum coccineum]
MVSELRLRYEHEIMSRERFQKKFTESCTVIQQRDAEIAALKAKLETTEKESMELSGLCGRVSELETKVVAKSEDIANLNKQTVELLGNVISLAINKGIHQVLEAEIEHGKAGRSLAQVEAYDTDVENKYVAAVTDFKNVSFSLLEELEALKDSLLALIMSALTLEGDADSTPKLRKLQPSLDQVTIPVYSKSSGSRGSSYISNKMLLSDAIHAIHRRAKNRGLVLSSISAEGGVVGAVPVQDSSLSVADYQVSTLVHTRGIVFVASLHDDLFDTTILDEPANL